MDWMMWEPGLTGADKMNQEKTIDEKRQIVNHIIHANTFTRRLKGLMGTKALPEDTGLLLEPCNSVHTWHMKYPIDVIYLNSQDQVLHIEPSMPPNTWGKRVKNAAKVLEINAGLAAELKIQTGDIIDLDPRGECLR